MKQIWILGICLGLVGWGLQAAMPPTEADALQVLKGYYEQEKEWWVDMGLIFPLSEGTTIRKKLVEGKNQTIEEYLYSHYTNLKRLEESGLVKIQIEEDSSTKVSRYKYTVQPTDKLLNNTSCVKVPGLWQVATYDRIEILRVEQVGVVRTNGSIKSVSVSYTYRLKPSILGEALGLPDKSVEGACQFIHDGTSWKVNDSLQPRQIFKNSMSQ